MSKAVWDLLPHRPPVVLVDRIVEVDPGAGARGVKLVSAGEEWMGGLALVEAMAQVAGVAWLGTSPGAAALLAGFSDACFLKPLRVGDSVEIEVRVLRTIGSLARVGGVARVAGEPVARAEVTLARDPR